MSISLLILLSVVIDVRTRRSHTDTHKSLRLETTVQWHSARCTCPVQSNPDGRTDRPQDKAHALQSQSPRERAVAGNERDKDKDERLDPISPHKSTPQHPVTNAVVRVRSHAQTLLRIASDDNEATRDDALGRSRKTQRGVVMARSGLCSACTVTLVGVDVNATLVVWRRSQEEREPVERILQQQQLERHVWRRQ